jgi:hypothetical protein
MAVATPAEQMFLVRVDGSHFFIEASGQQVSATDILSAALHLSYVQADRLCQSLVRRGYRMAVVTDALGEPVTAGTLKNSQPAKDNLPQTLTELRKIPVSVQRHRYHTDPAFRTRVDQLENPPASSR